MENNEEVVIFKMGDRATGSSCEAKWDEFIKILKEKYQIATMAYYDGSPTYWDGYRDALESVIKIAKEMKEG